MIRFITLNLIVILNYITECDRNSLTGMIHPTHPPIRPILSYLQWLHIAAVSFNQLRSWLEEHNVWNQHLLRAICNMLTYSVNIQFCPVWAISSLPGVLDFFNLNRTILLLLIYFFGHPIDRQSSVYLDLFLAFSLVTSSSSHCVGALHQWGNVKQDFLWRSW